MSVEMLTTETFDSRLASLSVPALVVFVTTWCPYCVDAKKVADGIAGSGDRMKVFLVDAEEEWELSERFAITQVPTGLLFSPGSAEPSVMIGNIEESSILGLLDTVRDVKARPAVADATVTAFGGGTPG